MCLSSNSIIQYQQLKKQNLTTLGKIVSQYRIEKEFQLQKLGSFALLHKYIYMFEIIKQQSLCQINDKNKINQFLLLKSDGASVLNNIKQRHDLSVDLLNELVYMDPYKNISQYIKFHHQSTDFSNSQNKIPATQSHCNDTIRYESQHTQPKICVQYESNLEKNREKIQEIKKLISTSKKSNPLTIKSQNKQLSINESKMKIEIPKPIRNVSNFSHDSRISTTNSQTTPLRSSSHDKQHSYMQMSKNYKSPLNRFKKIKYLGRGHISDVYSVIDTTTGMIAALKTIQKSLITSKGIQGLIKTEIAIQSLINHQNILKCYGVINDEKQIALVLELGDITLLNYRKEKKLQEKQIIDIIYQVLKGVSFLHQNGIIHRDIKPENILLQNGIVKLADLGICVKAAETNQYCGTPGYMAPEIMDKKKYNNKVDCFSIGVLLHELLFGKLPKIGQRINGDTQLINLMNQLLEMNPKNRLSCKQALEYDLFKLCERKVLKQTEMIKNTILWDC